MAVLLGLLTRLCSFVVVTDKACRQNWVSQYYKLRCGCSRVEQGGPQHIDRGPCPSLSPPGPPYLGREASGSATVQVLTLNITTEHGISDGGAEKSRVLGTKCVA